MTPRSLAVVAGPIAWDWQQRGHDIYRSQVSFHTEQAAKVLNGVLRTPTKRDVLPVKNELYAV